MDLIIADLHLTDAPLEEYRWGIFPWLEDLKEEYDIDNIYLLGDITEKKDNHSAKLVNRIVEKLYVLSSNINGMLFILRGNHDGVDPEWPFFKFVRGHEGIVFYSEPTFTIINQGILFLPHSKDPSNDWLGIINKWIKDTNIIFMHQTVKGARAANGFQLDGLDTSIFSLFNGLIFSGDIHTPQETGKVIYVGSPFPVYFGDSFIGNVILLDNNNWKRLEYNTIRRVMLDIDFATQPIGIHFPVHKGDQFKIKILVNRSDSDQFDKWKKMVRESIEKKNGVVVSMELKLAEEKNTIAKKRKFVNTDPITVLNRYCKVEGLDSYYAEKGKEFI